MNLESKSFLYDLLNTASATGFEQNIQKVVKKRMSKFAESIEIDYHGNLMVAINTKAKVKVMLAGHCDQIGMMVKYISDDGFIYVTALGGIDTVVLPGAQVSVHTKSGTIHGVVGRKPVHLLKAEERNKGLSDIKDAWIDVGAKNKKELEKKVSIGDSVTFRLGVTELNNDLVVSPGFDNKAGLFVAMEALRLCSESKISVALYSVSTVQEEIGLRGAQTAAYGINPDVGIAIDVTHASDNPGREDEKTSPKKLAAGPTISRGPNINPVVEKMLVDAAKSAKIPYQLSPASVPLGNDANAIQLTRAGVATGAIGIPNRYMHTQVEVCSLQDLENAAKLLAKFVSKITDKTDFRPS